MFRSLMLAVTLAATWCGLAHAESRVALVIGNSAYQAVPRLPNPANDAKAMAEMLKSAGFEVVAARDLTQSDMRRAIGDFTRKVAAKGPDTVALVYYGGHGVQVDGDNYLVPVDAQITQEADVPLQTLRLADMMNALAAVPSKARIVMLDACRNNPFSSINKTSGRGLAMVDAPNGSIISYATAPGSEAEDGDGRNSPYTSAFMSVAREPGLPIEQAFKKVRFSVNQATDGRQTPWESSSLTGDFSFFPGQPGQPQIAQGEPRVQPASYTTGQQVASLD
ncbi:MAG: caspase family protein, partial [Bradyrhizobium sp.]